MLRRSGFKLKPRKPLKRTSFKRSLKQLRRTKLNVVGHSDTATDKQEIQYLLREIVIKRDKKCILYGIKCYNEYGMEGIVFQAEHLVERSNAETFADARLVVLVCKNCHGWKHFTKSNHDQYDEWVKSKLSSERVKLWERCAENLHAHRTHKVDLQLEIIALKQELKKYALLP